MSDLNWNLRDILSEFKGSRLHVFMSIYLHKNLRNRSWPSNDLIAEETGLSSAPISESISWLLSQGVVMLVPYDKRMGDETKLPNRKNIYQLTGVVLVDGEYHPYLNMTPEGWYSTAADLELLGDSLLSKQLENSDSLLSKRLFSKRKGIKELKALEGIKDSIVKPKTKPAPKPSNQPVAKPKEKKAQASTSRKKLTPLQKALEALKPYRGLVHLMAGLCKSGYDAMLCDPEHNLSVKELEQYTAAAEDYSRLGGTPDMVGKIYAFIDNETQDRTWTIAPTSIVKNIAAYKSSVVHPQLVPSPVISRQSPNGGMAQPVTVEERRQQAAQLRAEREKIFGLKAAG